MHKCKIKANAFSKFTCSRTRKSQINKLLLPKSKLSVALCWSEDEGREIWVTNESQEKKTYDTQVLTAARLPLLVRRFCLRISEEGTNYKLSDDAASQYLLFSWMSPPSAINHATHHTLCPIRSWTSVVYSNAVVGLQPIILFIGFVNSCVYKMSENNDKKRIFIKCLLFSSFCQ